MSVDPGSTKPDDEGFRFMIRRYQELPKSDVRRQMADRIVKLEKKLTDLECGDCGGTELKHKAKCPYGDSDE